MVLRMISSELLDGYYSILGCCLLVKVKTSKQQMYKCIIWVQCSCEVFLDGC